MASRLSGLDRARAADRAQAAFRAVYGEEAPDQAVVLLVVLMPDGNELVERRFAGTVGGSTSVCSREVAETLSDWAAMFADGAHTVRVPVVADA